MGETQQFPVLGKRLKGDRDLSENKLQDSVGISARDFCRESSQACVLAPVGKLV